ncbi:MAG: hypothetical protein KAI77_08055 [Gammaproteobacteria bacterium]|nr:hypothetical protein [Gammaproteobacteria bacterium]
MNSQRLNDDLTDSDTDLDIETSDLELDSFTDAIEAEDVVQISQYTARRRIEELKEEQRLRRNIESYDDWD